MNNKNRRTVVITGGAGGLGSAMAARFAAQGCNIAIVDYDLAQGEKAVKKLGGEGNSPSSSSM